MSRVDITKALVDEMKRVTWLTDTPHAAAEHLIPIVERLLAARSQEAYDEMERVEKCGHLFANIQPNGCLVCKLLADEREKVRELRDALFKVRGITGHTRDCPDGLYQMEVLGFMTTEPQECSEACKAVDKAVREKARAEGKG